jgi:hypothetical protein
VKTQDGPWPISYGERHACGAARITGHPIVARISAPDQYGELMRKCGIRPVKQECAIVRYPDGTHAMFLILSSKTTKTARLPRIGRLPRLPARANLGVRIRNPDRSQRLREDE